ncbi:two-component regulator propeller domain-containing protein [Dehalogenimonas sp. THU2]|uniref:ligand-binding sensor domain-containing protein n=1 Tax=Dehalogenimonas sp. THU2 TaxID=3151121 RepID=UPI0032183D89
MIGLTTVTLETSTKAQSDNLYFTQLSVDEGLPHNLVYSIIQDGYGFLWFGTYGGLSRYDGIKFRTYDFNPVDESSLSSNSVYVLFLDSTGRIWVGTDGGGLNLFDPETDGFKRFQFSPDSTSISNNQIRAIAEDKNGNIWIGTAEGLNRLDPTAGAFQRYYSTDDPETVSSNNIFSLLVDSDQNLWVGTSNGLNRYLPDSDSFVRFAHDSQQVDSISDGPVVSLYEDDSGRFWIGSFIGGLDLYIPETNAFKHFRFDPIDNSLSDNTVYAICQDELGMIWIGTANGLNRLDPTTEQFTTYKNKPGDAASLSNNRIRAICQDNSGILWVGTYGGGVCKLDLKRNAFTLFYNVAGDVDSLNNNLVFALLEDGPGSVWVGTDGGGLNLLSSENTFKQYLFKAENLFQTNINSIRALHQSSSGILWIGTLAGLVKFNPTTECYKHYPIGGSLGNSIRTILEDSSGKIWLGTFTGGLALFDPVKEGFTFYTHKPENASSISNNTVYSIVEGDNGTLWVATGDGLNRFDPESGIFYNYKYQKDLPNGLANNQIFDLYKSSDGYLYLATNGGGLSKFDLATQRFETYTMDDGLASNIVYSVIGDDRGNLWLATNRGLTRSTTEEHTFINFTPYAGLKESIFNWGACTKDSEGKIYFGGDYGFVIVEPDLLETNGHIPPVHITDLFVNDIARHFPELVADYSILELKYTENSISIGFTALDYTDPTKNSYRYMLEGFDKTWHFTDYSQPFATYTNLDPGTYVFKVWGSNNDGIWTEISTDLTITIAYPFWQTWWFSLMAGFIVLSIVYSGYRLRVKALSDQRNRLEAKVIERTHELEKQYKKEKALHEELEREVKRRIQFTRALVHELKTPLTPMVSASDALANGLQIPLWHNLAEQLRQGAVSLNHRIDELLDLAKGEIGILTIKAEPTDIKELLEDITAFVSIQAQKQHHTLSLELTEPIPQVSLDRERIWQVILNLLNNAFKFTPDGGKICLHAEVKGEMLVVSVHDNGAGFTLEQQRRLFEPYHQNAYDRERLSGLGIGLALSKILVELHGGTIEVRSIRNKGSHVWFNVPING